MWRQATCLCDNLPMPVWNWVLQCFLISAINGNHSVIMTSFQSIRTRTSSEHARLRTKHLYSLPPTWHLVPFKTLLATELSCFWHILVGYLWLVIYIYQARLSILLVICIYQDLDRRGLAGTAESHRLK